MPRLFLALALLLPLSAIAATPAKTPAKTKGVPRVERGNLLLENLPEIPAALAERTNQYQQSRGASLQGWLGDQALITTRFAETSQVHRVAAPGADRQQLTFFPDPVGNAEPAPDGKSFLFTKDADGNEYYQIYRFDLADGSYKMLTDGKSRNASPLWSDRGDRLAFSTTRRNGKDTDVHVMVPDDKDSAPLVELEGNWAPVDWSADGSKLLVVKFISANQTELYVANVASRDLTRFHPADAPIAFGTARFSRDGKGVYYTADEDSEFKTLRYEEFAGGERRALSADIPWGVDDLELTDDGRYLAFTVNAGGVSELHLRDLKRDKAVTTPKLPIGLVFGLAFDGPGRRLGFVLNGARSPSDVFSFEVGKTELTRWTKSETGGLDATTFVEPALIEYESFDGRKIPAFVYRPAAKAGAKVPVLIEIHGGPEGQARPHYYAMTQFYVRELGIAVIEPNVRGSTGYGKSYLLLDNGFKREDSVKDIGALLDWVAKQPDLDAGRVAVIGGSYGGYMSLACMTHFNDRLRAGIDIVGISNFVTFLTNTKDYRRDLRRVEYGDEREPAMRAHLEKISPLTNAGKITKPLFVVQGRNDPRVPFTEAEQMVAKVRANGSTVWYLRAENEGHGFARKENADFQFYATVLFLRQTLELR